MKSLATELSVRLAPYAEDVCRRYLSNGRKSGRYWLVGDTANNKGQSLFVRLCGPDRGPGAAGKWTDAATGEHGDLLDLIRLACGFTSLADTLSEAREFLSDPLPPPQRIIALSPAARSNSARRLFKMASPLAGSPAERYLRSRAIPIPIHEPALRFHPSCYFKATEDGPRSTLPALLAAITDNAGSLTAVHRIWLLPDGSDKARLDAPRKTLGPQQGHAVRFGTPGPVLIAGEGIESVLSIRTLLPHLPAAAALSANHLAALILAPELKRLYIAQDNDPAGWRAARVLADAAHTAAIEPRLLNPSLDDWNTALREEGSQATLTRLCALLDPLDLPAF